MKKYILVLFCFFISIDVSAKEFDISNFSFDNITNINSFNIKTNEEDYNELAKATTYLLLGGYNNKNENSLDYYKRYKSFFKLQYTKKTEDDKSIENQKSTLASFSLIQVFNQLNDRNIIYNNIDNIKYSKYNDSIVLDVFIKNASLKEEDSKNPLKYKYIKTSLVLHYYYSIQDNNYKLYYLYAEYGNDINTYYTQKENNETVLTSKIYEPNNINYLYDNNYNIDTDLIYNMNINNSIYLESYYNSKLIETTNGVLIKDGLVLTTSSFIENALMNSSNIYIKDNNFNNLEILGIVYLDKSIDICIIKLKEKKPSSIELSDVNIDNTIITISSTIGLKFNTNIGKVLSNNNYLKTTLSLTSKETGSPIYSDTGKLVGINISIIDSIDGYYAINYNILNEIYNKFDYNSPYISFDILKEDYYNNYKNEKKQIIKYGKYDINFDLINLNLIKATYNDNVLALRYKNDISEYIKTSDLIKDFINYLDKSYKNKIKSQKKLIYENNKYRISIIYMFDYVIVSVVNI